MKSKFNYFPIDSEESLIDYYGKVGLNQKQIVLPYTHYYWENNKHIKSLLCHKKIADSLIRVLTNVLDHYGKKDIHRLHLDILGGCLYLRSIRGGTRFSTHSWGIAIDYDPKNNQYEWNSEKALFARPEYEMWWNFWEAEGWYSLGRRGNYDWMHIQAAIKEQNKV